MGNRASLLKAAFAIVLAGLMGIAFSVPNASAAPTTKARMDSISDQVHHQLVTLPWYGVFDNLEYQVDGGQVTLTGQLVSEHSVTKGDAEKAVKSIPGVTSVVNKIEVLPPSPFDNQIRRAEYHTVFSHGELGRYTMGAIPQVHIIVKNGHVTLEGVVMNQMDKNMAGIFANTVSGVFSVENNLRIGS